MNEFDPVRRLIESILRHGGERNHHFCDRHDPSLPPLFPQENSDPGAVVTFRIEEDPVTGELLFHLTT